MVSPILECFRIKWSWGCPKYPGFTFRCQYGFVDTVEAPVRSILETRLADSTIMRAPKKYIALFPALSDSMFARAEPGSRGASRKYYQYFGRDHNWASWVPAATRRKWTSANWLRGSWGCSWPSSLVVKWNGYRCRRFFLVGSSWSLMCINDVDFVHSQQVALSVFLTAQARWRQVSLVRSMLYGQEKLCL